MFVFARALEDGPARALAIHQGQARPVLLDLEMLAAHAQRLLAIGVDASFALGRRPADELRHERRGVSRAWLRWGLVVAWMGVVLAFGSTTIFPENHQVPRFVLRKAAHLGLYAMLGLLCYVALAPRARHRAGAGHAVAALGLVVVIAAVDEGHQAFVPGRAARAYDVGLDTVGGAAGLLAARFGLGARPRREDGDGSQGTRGAG